MPNSSSSNINNVFFEGVYKEVWKKLIPPGLSQAECDFIIDEASLQEGDQLLDIMCGYGRHALELSRKGIKVSAVDNSSEYIQEIDSVVCREQLPVKAILSDVLSIDLDDCFKAAICMGNSFAFFNKEEASYLLKNISHHLIDGGILIINSWMIAEIAINHFKAHDWLQVDKYKYLLDYKFHFIPSRIESEHTIVTEDGVYEVIKGVDYIYTIAEIEEMFLQAGLTTKYLYSTPRKRKFSLGDSSIYIVAEKKS
ncbi:MAG: class I SAM-dependent methyltransferase [Candidatus Dadabacteria bacterium]